MSTTSISPPTHAPSPRPFLGFEVPRPLRTLVRARESSLAILGAMVGALAGLLVAAMSFGVTLLHALLFGVPPGQRLSSLSTLDPYIAMTVPSLGGLAFGLAFYALGRWRPLREVDPIEANALHGGRMSLFGSLSVALQTVWSSGVGASVGLEAGYTQLASGVASRIGRAFRLRRRDLRLLVGCGAAGNSGAEMLLRERYSDHHAMISFDDALPYDRPNLSEDFLAGQHCHPSIDAAAFRGFLWGA